MSTRFIGYTGEVSSFRNCAVISFKNKLSSLQTGR